MTSAPEWTYRHATELRDHWWWRPGWHVGTRFYAWHITLDDAPELYPLVEFWRERLRTFDYLDLVPDRWLHLTMQGIGMVEDVPDERRDQLVSAVRRRLVEHAPVTAQFHRPVVRPEAIVLPAIPPEAIESIRDAVRAGMADVLGDAAVPERAKGFQPHVSLAYVSREQPASEVVDALGSSDDPEPTNVTIANVSLIEMHRDNRMYEWRTIGSVSVGGV